MAQECLHLPHPLQRQTIVPGPTAVLKGPARRRGTHQSLELVHVGQLEGAPKADIRSAKQCPLCAQYADGIGHCVVIARPVSKRWLISGGTAAITHVCSCGESADLTGNSLFKKAPQPKQVEKLRQTPRAAHANRTNRVI